MVLTVFFVAPDPFNPQLIPSPKSTEAAASVNKTSESQIVKRPPYSTSRVYFSSQKGSATSRQDVPSNGITSRLPDGYWNPENPYNLTSTSSKHNNGQVVGQPGPMATPHRGTLRDLVFRIGRNIDGVSRSLCIFRTTFRDQNLWEKYIEYIGLVIADAVQAFNTTPDHDLHIHRTPLTLDRMEHWYFQGKSLLYVRNFFLNENMKVGPSVLEDHFIYVDENTLETFRIYDTFRCREDAFRRRYPQNIQNVFGSHHSSLSEDHVTVYQVDAADRGIRDMSGRHLFTRGVLPKEYPTLRPSDNPVEERGNMDRLRKEQPFLIFEASPEEEQRDHYEQKASAPTNSWMDLPSSGYYTEDLLHRRSQ